LSAGPSWAAQNDFAPEDITLKVQPLAAAKLE
jgi:hypothetical protein